MAVGGSLVKLVSIGEPQHNGTRTLYFELNGQSREISNQGMAVEVEGKVAQKADPTNPNEIGATLSGTVLKVVVSKGSFVKLGDHLTINEAMKMETTVQATNDGIVKEIHVVAGDTISTGNLLIELM